MRCAFSFANLSEYMTHLKLSNVSSLLVEIKNPRRKGSKLPLWHMEVSALGGKSAWTDFQELPLT